LRDKTSSCDSLCRHALVAALLVFGATPRAHAAGSASAADLGSVSLRDLLQMEVTSVSRRPEQLSQAPAAVFALTREDILRSGCTSLPDLLRLVPGMQVAQINSSLYAVSARGFADRFARNLLVLVDGRSVYTPSFSGVYWESQDLPLDEIERVEVIRGPGATLWGANAVNGVINIITRRAVDAQGAHVQVGKGTAERGLVSARFGTTVGPRTAMTGWGKLTSRNGTVDQTGSSMADAWTFGTGGFRFDSGRPNASEITVQGALYGGRQDLAYDFPTYGAPFEQILDAQARLRGGHLLARWERSPSPGSDMSLQGYIDRADRADVTLGEYRTTYDLDFQDRFHLLPRLGLIWGAEGRYSRLRLTGSPYIEIDGGSGSYVERLASGFLQAEFAGVPDRLQFIGGVKLEGEDEIGLQIQPNVRLLWTPRPKQTVWGSVSRAVRTPSIGEQHVDYWLATAPPTDKTGNLPAAATLQGNDQLQGEHLTAWEAGYRVQPSDVLYLDLAAYVMDYSRVRGLTSLAPSYAAAPVPHLEIPLLLSNIISGSSRGFELSGDWYARHGVRIHGSFSRLWVHEDLSPNASTAGFQEFLNSPADQGLVGLALDLGRNWDLDLTARYVAALPGLGIPAYGVLDGRLAWRPLRRWELSISGRNLGVRPHTEMSYEFNPTPASIKPGIYTACSWGW